ncbi:MAG: class I SAM-dependent methyltransferase [Promethearchaeota archaeon]
MENNNKTTNKKKRIKSQYDITAHFYDRRYLKIQYEKYEYILKNYIIKNKVILIIKNKVILDAGCGTGLLLEFITNSRKQNQGIRYSFIATDISWNMLTRFKLKINGKEMKIRQRINLILSDLENLPFRGSVFNSIFALTSFQNLPNIIDGVNESFRVVKNEADVMFSILKKKLKKDELITVLKKKIKDLEIIDEKSLEDIIFKGIIIKK